MVDRWAWVLLGLGAGVVGLVAAGAAAAGGRYGDLPHEQAVWWVGYAVAAGVAYAAAVGVVRGRELPAWTVWAVIGLGLMARAVTWAGPPLMSTDLYRYVWDGRVQAAGINPYRYVPSDPALAPLRDPPAEGWHAELVFPNINRAETAKTIYPPAAQGLFALMGLAGPGVWAVKGVMLGFDLVAMGAGLALLRRAGRPLAWIVVWAWCPLVIWEFAGSGHIDAAAAGVSGLALAAAARGRPGWAGAALGVAVLLKLLPAALFPAVWRRWDWRAPLAAGAVIAAGYACYSSVGWGVFGYLGGYAAEEGLDGGGLLVLRLLAPVPGWGRAAYGVGAVALLGGVAAWVALRPARGVGADVIGLEALVLAGALIAVLSPHYPWYLTMLVLPAVVVRSWAALWPVVAAPLLYLDHDLRGVGWSALVYVPAALLLVFDVFGPARALAVPGGE